MTVDDRKERATRDGLEDASVVRLAELRVLLLGVERATRGLDRIEDAGHAFVERERREADERVGDGLERVTHERGYGAEVVIQALAGKLARERQRREQRRH